MLPDEVREAVEAVESHADDLMHCIGVLHAFKEMRPVGVEFSKAVDELKASTQTIRTHLLAREAKVERLQNIADGNAELYQHELLRTARADALLRACRQMLPDYCGELEASITAHLSENSRG